MPTLNPWPILAALATSIFLLLCGVHIGKKLDHDDWMAEKLSLEGQHEKDLKDQVQRYVRLENFSKATARKATEDHEQDKRNTIAAYEIRLAARAAAGGLRIPTKSICPAALAGPVAAGASGPDGTGAGAESLPEQAGEDLSSSVRLPEPIEHSLYEMTLEADKLSDQLRNLQRWIQVSGLYGPRPDGPVPAEPLPPGAK